MILVIFHFLLYGRFSEAYENLALQRPTYQENPWSDNYWGAGKAVDGRYTDRSAPGGQCTISNNAKQTATWRVDLERLVSISHINIFYRTDNQPRPSVFVQRMAGFFLYVSNTTSKDNSHLCFHEIQRVAGTPSEDQRINCSVHGRYVIYYNERRTDLTYPSYYSQYAFNELCELQVFGCASPKFYGENCAQPCPDKCQEEHCDINTGQCPGCKPGYQGPFCSQECSKKTYGLECSVSCGNCSNGETCHHINGTCLNGCSEGVNGTKCLTACLPGYYDKNCRYRCSDNCGVPNSCDRFTGQCVGGCQPGWKGIRCDQKCDGRMYGANCNENCGNCLDNEQCDHINGTCFNGCTSGYMGNLCNETCSIPYWGAKCREICSTGCLNQTCHHVSGKCLLNVESHNDDSSDSIHAGVIGGVVAAFAIVIIIIVSLIIFRRFRSLKTKQPGEINIDNKKVTDFAVRNDIYENLEESSPSRDHKGQQNIARSDQPYDELEIKNNDKEDDMDDDEKLHEENPYGDLYINEESIPDISINKLEKIIKEYKEEEDDGFKKEYATLPYGERKACEAGKLSENIPKNRFKTTFPYDHSRVKLSNRKPDYINANFIDSLEKMNAYIAAQGPKQNTLSDFWTLVWQENVRQIVMLTNLKEDNKVKCIQYWPDLHKSSTSGVLSLSLEEEKIYAFYIIRKIKITHKGLKDSRLITQYHYTAWPDHGTPEPLCLVVFHDHVTRTREKQYGGPTLVHCSAGIGRTGTYIAIDALHQEGQKHGRVNIAEYVKTMRENRMNMIQTYEQYKTVFLVLNEMFKAPSRVCSRTEFVKKAELLTRDKPANESELRKEFQNLLKVRPLYSEADYKNALKHGNRKSSVLPLDKFSLFLSSNVPKRGNYINAITLQSYTNQKAFIVTHYPTEEDAVDFLRLLTDHESDIVICMDPLTDIDSSKVWLPDAHRSKNIPPFTVHCQQEQHTNIKCTTVHIVSNGMNDEASSVAIVQPMYGLKPSDHSTSVSQLLGLVSFISNNEPEGPVTIVSRNGADLCGVFCAVYNIIQQLQMDGEVDIFTTVRQLQIRRPELCSSMEEYGLIYNCVLNNIRALDDSSAENIYYNQ
ncbi:receptor-type tyrosine-protein phosphatase alpha-like [Saccostrea cucullata]|uniref:receptor-type tyrosine-protein phosphatase alpha-like n=1 Tax=Saccostrea cuccullata TaxID=36930 RepID=UPI002ED31F5B